MGYAIFLYVVITGFAAFMLAPETCNKGSDFLLSMALGWALIPAKAIAKLLK